MKRAGKMQLAIAAAMNAALSSGAAIVVGDKDGKPDLPEGAKLHVPPSATARSHSRNRASRGPSQAKRRRLARRRNAW